MDSQNGAVLKVLVVAPRNHPNMHHFLTALSTPDSTVELWASYLTAEGPKSNDKYSVSEIPESSQDIAKRLLELRPALVVIRHYPKNVTQALREYMSQNPCIWIQYDQKPLGAGHVGWFVESVRALIRMIRRRPTRRITPVFVSQRPVRPSRFAEFFSYPFDKDLVASSSEDARPAFGPVKTILTIGKIGQRRKRLRHLVKALSQADFAGELLVIGLTRRKKKSLSTYEVGSFERDLNMLRKRLNGRFTIKMFTDIPHDECLSLMASSDIFCLPSVREPFAISPMEAMALGVPTIITRSNGARTYVESGRTGLILSSTGKKHLAHAVKTLGNDGALRHSLSAQSKLEIKKNHSPKSLRMTLGLDI